MPEDIPNLDPEFNVAEAAGEMARTAFDLGVAAEALRAATEEYQEAGIAAQRAAAYFHINTCADCAAGLGDHKGGVLN